jgi:hypothetical protein
MAEASGARASRVVPIRRARSFELIRQAEDAEVTPPRCPILYRRPASRKPPAGQPSVAGLTILSVVKERRYSSVHYGTLEQRSSWSMLVA